MAIGEGYFTAKDLETALKFQFSYEEMFDIDFKTVFSHIEDHGKYYQLRLRGRLFRIDKLTGSVREVEKNV